MTNDDLSRFATMMTGVADYYKQQLSDFVLKIYWEGLKGYDYPAIEQAISRHMMNSDTGQFMPKIADIIRMLQGSSQDAAFSAWTKVDKAIRQIGAYETVVFDDPLIHRVLHDMGGWIGLSQKTEEEWPFVAREFENRYRGFKSRNEQVEYPARLIGIFEAHNAKEGQKISEPVLIGDSGKANFVMNGGSDSSKMLEINRASNSMQKIPALIENK